MNNSFKVFVGEVGFYLSQQSKLENAICDSGNHPSFEKLTTNRIYATGFECLE